MVSNLWKTTKVVCSRDRTELVLGHDYSYSCTCGNCITLKDYEKMLAALSDLIISNDENGVMGYLSGEKFTIKTIHFVILEHNPLTNEMTISVENRKVLREKGLM